MADEKIVFDVEFANFSSRLLREMEGTGQGFANVIADAMNKGADAGLGKAMPGFQKKLRTAWSAASEEVEKAKVIWQKASKMKRGEDRDAIMRDAEFQMRAAKTRFEAETKHTRALIDRRYKAHKASEDFLNKGMSQRVGSMAEGLSKAFSQAKGGDIKGLAGSISGGAQVAKGVAGAGASAGVAGAGAAGGLAASIGAVAIPLAVIAGAFAAIIKLMIDATSQGKEFNRTLLAGSGAGDMMWKINNTGATQLRDSLQQLRGAATDFVHNVKWGTTSKDMMDILTSANAAGHTFKEMAETSTRLQNGMEGYRAVTELSLRYSKLLGVEATTIAEGIAEWEHDLGLGLSSLEESFGKITKLAMESGFGVKRFYTMVQQATSGMALYNVRVEETAALLAKTGKILGESEAKDFITTLQKGFAQEDYTTKLKRVLLTGSEDSQRIIAGSAARTGKAFVKNFGSPLETALSEMDVDPTISAKMFDSSGDGLVKALGSMTKSQQRELIARMAKTDSTAAMKLEGLVDLSEAALKGGTDNMVDALDNLDMGGKLAFMLDAQVLGNKHLSEMSAQEKHIFATTQGLDAEMVDKLARIDGALLGQFELAKKGDEQTLQMLGLIGEGATEEEKKAAAEKVSAMKFSDFAAENGKLNEDIIGSLSQQEALAQSTVEHTRDMSNILKNGIQFMLEQIYTLMSEAIGKFMGMGEGERGEKRKAEGELKAQLTLLSGGLTKAQEEETSARQAVATAQTEADKKIAQDALDKAEIGTAHAEAGVEATKAMLGELAALGAGKFTHDLGASDAKRFRERAATATATRGIDPKTGLPVSGIATGVLGEGGASAAHARGVAEKKAVAGGAQGYYTEHGATGFGMEGQALGHNVYTQAAFGGGIGAISMGDVGRTGMDAVSMGGWRGGAAGLQGMGYATNALGKSGQARVGGETVGADMVEALDLQMEDQAGVAEAERKSSEADEKKRVKDAADALKEQERLRKVLPEAVAQGEELFWAKQLLGAAGMDKSKASTLLGGQGLEAAQELRAQLRGNLAGTDTSDWDPAQMAVARGVGVKDFIFQGGKRGGLITPIDKADEFLGMKPGGAMDKGFGGAGGTTNIYVQGGDLGKVMQAVRMGIRASQGKRQ